MTEIPHRNPSTAVRTPAGTRCAGRERTRYELEQKLRAEFMALPRLVLTVDQARRLWNVTAPCCHEVLRTLVEEGFLARTPSGSFVRADALPFEEAGVTAGLSTAR